MCNPLILLAQGWRVYYSLKINYWISWAYTIMFTMAEVFSEIIALPDAVS